jgi:DNA-binding transcriptional LysR family regulator
LEELRAFVAVAEALSFTAAAGRLQVTTNAVSQRVRRLEEALGVRLFVRTTRSVAMTDEGAIVHRTVARLLNELDALEGEVRPDRTDLRGNVRIALPGVLASAPFYSRLQRLQDEHPLLAVQTMVSNRRSCPPTGASTSQSSSGALPKRRSLVACWVA